MKTKIPKTRLVVFIPILILGLCIVPVLYVVVSNEFMIHSAKETIRANENISKEVSISVWIVEHEWKSDWYVLGYMFEKCDYTCSNQEKENTPWICNNIRCDTVIEYVWFNIQTKETHDV